MSTQKNEQYHILSPEWLRTNPLPDDAEGQSHGGNWFLSDYRGEKLPNHIELVYRTRRTDLPPEAYITPPTDTTGSGREGETVEYCPICTYPTKETPGDSVCRCKGIQTWALSCYPGEVAFVKMHPNNSAPSFYRRDDADKRIDQLERQRDAALAQVEALRRAAKEFEKQVARRLWTSDDGVNIRASDPGDYIDDDPALATAWSLFRAAIDSAQRQEGR